MSITVGQKVWMEGRKHATIPSWYDAYGVIADVIYDADIDEDEDAVIEEVIVKFETGQMEIITVDRLCVWDDRNSCWNIFEDILPTGAMSK